MTFLLLLHKWTGVCQAGDITIHAMLPFDLCQCLRAASLLSLSLLAGMSLELFFDGFVSTLVCALQDQAD